MEKIVRALTALDAILYDARWPGVIFTVMGVVRTARARARRAGHLDARVGGRRERKE